MMIPYLLNKILLEKKLKVEHKDEMLKFVVYKRRKKQ